MLKPGDIIKSESKIGYDLVIPRYEEPELQKIYQEAQDFAEGFQDEERVRKFNEFVHQAFTFDQTWNEGKKWVNLIQALIKRRGVCKELAATLDLFLTLEGIESHYIRGKLRTRHAWLKVKIKNEDFLVDPTTNDFLDYALVTETHPFYVEEGNKIISLFD